MSDIGKLILRLGMGALMLTHGYPKLLRLFSGQEIKFSDPLGIGALPSLIFAVFAEVICSVAIMIGFKTRWASIPVIITMLTIFFVIHADDPFKRKELALAYAVTFIVIYFIGPGKYSVDQKLNRFQ
ncbi:MAG TPA: DoxX family protein [Saprospiraceae bacterium]|nr:DoxX family protein [Saprospiraceae bacterium]